VGEVSWRPSEADLSLFTKKLGQLPTELRSEIWSLMELRGRSWPRHRPSDFTTRGVPAARIVNRIRESEGKSAHADWALVWIALTAFFNKLDEESAVARAFKRDPSDLGVGVALKGIAGEKPAWLWETQLGRALNNYR
jgi:hypothetical protein